MDPRSMMMQQAGPSSGSSRQKDDGQNNRQSKKNNVRKRTKTGCLTCRKRRIKCDEGRPICANCIKSKRQCEGYAPRVVFKEPLSASQGPFQPTVFGNPGPQLPQVQGNRPPLTPIAPRPPNSPQHGQHQFMSTQGSSFGGLTQRQYGRSASAMMGQYDFNSYLAAGGLMDEYNYSQNMPNPLAAADAVSGLPQEPPDRSMLPYMGNAQLPPYSAMQAGNTNQGFTAFEQGDMDDIYDDDDAGDDDAMSVSDDGLPDPGDRTSRGMMALADAWSGNQINSRKFNSFAESGALFLYVDSPANSDLRNIGETTVFSHFISVTSPTISMYERHPCDPVEKQEFHASGHNLWSYTLPVMAFHHPALLNAMLALGSFQMANSVGYGNRPYAAMKHYSRAIRRIARNVNAPSRKTHIATLAATLLLGYFEVWNANHKHWCKHLNGASSLLREIPLRYQARLCLPRRKAIEKERIESDPSFIPKGQEDLDYELLTAITGREISAEDYGLEEDGELNAQSFAVTERDIEKFENFSDLYWWFSKMDVYQSILGGTKLFMDYKNWAQCPPRAPMAKFGLIYGTYDHLILLLGRVADFASRDLSRKRKAAKNQAGGQPGSTPPPFAGIIPMDGSAPVPLPLGFSPPSHVSPRSEPSDDSDPKTRFEIAVEEWKSIRQAFEKLKQSFGSDFQPLSMEYADRRESPFGLAVQYRTFSIAGVWMNYYMGLIHLYRAHPTMPPANMQAAGMTAKDTGTWANQIGRIAAGLWDDDIKTSDDPLLVAALIESSFCLFVAGVQFQDDAQRHWLVQRMHDVDKYTGWKSAKEIAAGCEAAWTKAAQMGRGPEYTRVVRVQTDRAESIWRSERRLDAFMNQRQEGDSRVIVSRSDRAQYALGLLGAEEDLARLDLRDDDRNHSEH